MIELKSVVERTRLFDPSGNEIEQVIEHRTDPLTSTVASVNPMLGEKAKAFLGTAELDLLRDLQERSKVACPFCNASEKGTRFTPEMVPEGRLRVGNSIAIPNLFSKCRYDAVIILDPSAHVLFPSQIPTEGLANAIRASAEIVRRARAVDPAIVHHVVGMNFLQPGGSSVPHPHFQAHVRSVPYSAVDRLARASAEFLARTGTDYWTALVEKERELGARWIGEGGGVAWLAAWAPAHQKEIWGVLPGVGSLCEIDDAHAAAFAAGISRVIASYEAAGTHPFTFAFLSSPELGRGKEYALQVRICARPAFKALYANYDTWFAPKIVGDEVHTEAPEAYAARIRASW